MLLPPGRGRGRGRAGSGTRSAAPHGPAGSARARTPEARDAEAEVGQGQGGSRPSGSGSGARPFRSRGLAAPEVAAGTLSSHGGRCAAGAGADADVGCGSGGPGLRRRHGQALRQHGRAQGALGPSLRRLLATLPEPLQQARADRGHRAPRGDAGPEAALPAAPDQDQQDAALGRALLPRQRGALGVHPGGLHRGPPEPDHDHLHPEHQPRAPDGGGGALRLPREPREQRLDGGAAGSLDFLQPFRHLPGRPGVRPGPVQEQRDQEHQGLRVRAG